MEVPAVGGTTTDRVGTSRDNVERCGKKWRSAREGAMRSWTDAPMRMLRYGTSRLPISPIVVRCQRSVDRVLVLLEKIRRRPPTMMTRGEVDGGREE